MRSRLLVAAAVLAAVVPGAAATAWAGPAPPRVPTAAAAIVVDARDGTVMFAKRPDQERSIASTTKLMTALLALEEADPDEVFTAPEYNAMPAESRINLRAGERMTVQDLLEALLLESANDAAVDLAENIAGSREAFVEQMNERAEELGLEHTSYANPIGLDEAGNHSSARDLAALARMLLRNPRFARIVDMPSATLESGNRPRVVQNRNDLVAAYPWVAGVKTGYTLNAGNVLGGAAARGPRARVVSVVGGGRRGGGAGGGRRPGGARGPRGGPPRRRDAHAVALGPRAVQARADGEPRARAGELGHQVLRREGRSRAAPGRFRDAARRPAGSHQGDRARRARGAAGRRHPRRFRYRGGGR